ncbi:autotransporter outer membrane beta-barrel domain-containing protein [Magnetospira sp. QH-2]|uniref:autotransporter outer membrane beta-barrel domain-containing protein n=1 Tax=Magnetospira sp. (strain QH-2) TaxID=1288970 RepID=UPI0003E8145E|nr:autotransporter outer membrane beta-barrel domain-containing protein [Magnetospira sp. QH-2]CCQ72509.1 conserved exported protein of unknown function; putative autotransporter [Magnetospira sp. QH-2]
MKTMMKRALTVAAMAGCAATMINQGAKADVGDDRGPSWMASYSCSDATYGTTGSYWTSHAAGASPIYGTDSRATYDANCTSGHTSNSAASVVTAVQTLRAATAQTVGLITSRIATQRQAANVRPISVSLGQGGKSGEIGLAGGDKNRGMGVWLQGSFTAVEDDNASTAFDGHIFTALVGIDKKLANDRLLLGLAAGYEMGDFDTTFNSGNLESSGFIVAPYLSFAINNVFSIDATAGYGMIDYDQDRADSVTNEVFKGETDADRFFGSLTLNATKTFKKKIEVTGNLGASYTNEDRDAFTETGSTGTTVAVAKQSTKLGQAQLGVKVGYNLGKATPYIGVNGEYDFTKSSDPTVASNQTQPDSSDYGARVALGATFALNKRVSGMLEGNYVFLRDNYKEYGGVAKIRFDF